MRNYKSEAKWQKGRYITIRANLDRNLGQSLKDKLKKDNITIASWIRENAKKYLEP